MKRAYITSNGCVQFTSVNSIWSFIPSSIYRQLVINKSFGIRHKSKWIYISINLENRAVRKYLSLRGTFSVIQLNKPKKKILKLRLKNDEFHFIIWNNLLKHFKWYWLMLMSTIKYWYVWILNFVHFKLPVH